MMLLKIVMFLILFTPATVLAQGKKPDKSLLPVAVDSCILVVREVVTKEMIPPNGVERDTEVVNVQISQDNVRDLLRQALSKSSYNNSMAMLTHSNLTFEFYENQLLVAELSISTITGNIKIQNYKSRKEYHNSISSKFGSYLLEILDRYQLTSHIAASDMDGLTELK